MGKAEGDRLTAMNGLGTVPWLMVARRGGCGSLLWLERSPPSFPPTSLHFDLFPDSSVPSCFHFNKYFDGVRAGFGTLRQCEASVGGNVHSLFLSDLISFQLVTP